MVLVMHDVLVKVYPSCREEKVNVTEKRIMMYLKEDPVRGMCNKRAAEILAKLYNVSIAKVVLVVGATKQQKRFVIYD